MSQVDRSRTAPTRVGTTLLLAQKATTSRLTAHVLLCFGYAAILLAVACRGGDDEVGEEEGTPTTDASTTTVTQPAASEDGHEQAFGIVENVVLEATDLADGLLQHPEAVNDPENTDIARLRALYTDDSAGPGAIIDRLHQLVDDGQTIRAAPSGVFRQLRIFQISAADENTVRFRICAVQDQEIIDTAEHVVSRFAEITQGTGEARRVAGVWRLYGIHRDAHTSFQIVPGSADPGTCDDLYPTENPA